jgi:hypothetical protein
MNQVDTKIKPSNPENHTLLCFPVRTLRQENQTGERKNGKFVFLCPKPGG